MRILLRAHTWYFGIAILAALVSSLWLYNYTKTDNSQLITAIAELGTVTETVSVSGSVEAKNTADLAFPVVGKVTEVFVEEGAQVKTGEVLATLGSASLVAQRNEATAALKIAQGSLAETQAGASSADRSLAATKLANANANLERVRNEEALKVENARKALLSNQLQVTAANPNETATPPTVSGTYSCTTEGTYTLSVYSSGSDSGYAYKYNGLETGTNPAYVDQPGKLGNCGLYLQFADNVLYGSSEWNISIPNTKTSSYITSKNAYDLAVEQEKNAISTAENAVAAAEKEAGVITASARGEVVAQRQGAIEQARARVASIDAELKDRSIVAPFDGVITNVDILPGETATAVPVITILASNTFKLVARIPEIDITKIEKEQKVDIIFDAAIDQPQSGQVTYISPLATQIDGVAYFETTILMDNTPTWLRSGLNADVEITTAKYTDVVRIPKRFTTTNGNISSVKVLALDKIKTVPVEILFVGNDGYVAIKGIDAGATVVAP